MTHAEKLKKEFFKYLKQRNKKIYTKEDILNFLDSRFYVYSEFRDDDYHLLKKELLKLKEEDE